MRQTVALVACLVLTGTASAGDVYVTKDSQGNTIYTDTPQIVPAQKVQVRNGSSAADTAGPAIAPTAKQPAQQSQTPGASPPSQQPTPQQPTAEDRAKRCADARQKYQDLMNSWRVYEPGPDGERTYLTSEQIDAARANAKKVMDEFCAGQ